MLVELTGVTALLMHGENINGQTDIQRWRKSKTREGASVGGKKGIAVDNEDAILTYKTKGDDRVPAWTWLTYLYHGDQHVAMPSANIQAGLCKAGSKVIDPRGKGNKTLKNEAASCLVFEEEYPQFLVNGKQIPIAPLMELMEIDDGNLIDEHQAVCEKYGFSLDIRRAGVNGSKHVRVRPRFENWTIRARVELLDTTKLDKKQLLQLFEVCGQVVGLGDWRPGSPKMPGVYGKFSATIKDR